MKLVYVLLIGFMLVGCESTDEASDVRILVRNRAYGGNYYEGPRIAGFVDVFVFDSLSATVESGEEKYLSEKVGGNDLEITTVLSQYGGGTKQWRFEIDGWYDSYVITVTDSEAYIAHE